MPDINGIPYVESTDLVSAYPAASQALAQEVSDQLASKVDYALPVNAQTGTTYTFVAADAEKLTTASNAAAVTLTIPPQSSVTWSDNTVLRVVNYGAGAVTIDGGSGVTVTNTSSTIAQYGAAVAIRTGSDAWTVVPFGGGDVPSATVSSPAATGQYTDTGITYDYYTFTASGTLTVDTAGFADVLVVGGGGGGGRHGGGGGAGGHLYATDVYLAAGTATIRVGAGGGGGTVGNGQFASGLNGNTSGIGDYIVAPGGGGGGGTDKPGSNGGSGGGGGNAFGGAPVAGAGFAPQGNDGGAGESSPRRGGGGGGASAAGATGSASGNGGAGLANSITGSSVTRGGGGGGGSQDGTAGSGGSGGGGNGTNSNSTGTAGTANTGGGGGGGGRTGASGDGGAGGAGGSGIVIVRVKV